MSVQSQIEHLLQRYVQAFNAHDMKILDLFQSRAEVYTPYSPPAVGHKELQALHTKWFTHKIAYKGAAVQHLTSRDGVAYCFASYALTRSYRGRGRAEGNRNVGQCHDRRACWQLDVSEHQHLSG